MATSMDTDIVTTLVMQEKTSIINNELLRFKVNIQKTCSVGKSSIREKHFTFFWHGKSVDERIEHHVSFTV